MGNKKTTYLILLFDYLVRTGLDRERFRFKFHTVGSLKEDSIVRYSPLTKFFRSMVYIGSWIREPQNVRYMEELNI